ncbi:hypothetical protein MNBD_NITROSPINAE02-342 [hydrothermal vent metagenome]|uniref:Polymer-forming cytoskeletal protein n=1 Tax=hydrothermal vent metagenome TaxID=652676 RepID=A0A3B1CFH3_9ZZZZ
MGSGKGDKDVIRAFLGEDTDFKGLLSFEGTVRLDGRFEGEVTSDDNLIIGESAEVKAEIHVGTVLIQGKVEGNIRASKKLTITNKGKVIGNVDTTALHIEEGAVLEGKVTMITHEDAKALSFSKKNGDAPKGNLSKSGGSTQAIGKG